MAKKTTDGDNDQGDGAATESDEDEDGKETADEDGKATKSDEDDGEEDEDDEAAVLATLTPAQAKVFNKLNENLSKANASSRARRLALRALRAGQQNGTAPKPTATKKDTEGKAGAPAAFDPAAFKAELLAALKGEQEAGKVQTTAQRELRKAGLILPDDPDAAERKLQRVMRMMELDGVALDEVAEEVADLKADNPELFGKQKKRRPAAGGVGGPARVTATKASDAIAGLFD